MKVSDVLDAYWGKAVMKSFVDFAYGLRYDVKVAYFLKLFFQCIYYIKIQIEVLTTLAQADKSPVCL